MSASEAYDLIRAMQPASSVQMDAAGEIYVDGKPLSGGDKTNRVHRVFKRDLKPHNAIALGRGRYMSRRPEILFPDHWSERRKRECKRPDIEPGVVAFHRIFVTECA